MSDEPKVPDGEAVAAETAESAVPETPLANGDAQRVLNSEEVDALLRGLSQGNIPLSRERVGNLRVRPYDLANPAESEWTPMPALDLISERAVPRITLRLSRRLSYAVRARAIPMQVRDYGRFIRSFEPPVAISILNMTPGAVSAVLVMGAQTVYRMIDLIFGGKPSEAISRSAREFTRIEVRTIASIVRELLKGIEEAWQEIVTVNFAWMRLETRPQFAGVIPPSDHCVLMQWEVDFGVGDGDQFILCIPTPALELMPQLRDQIEPEEGEEYRGRSRQRIRASLQDVPVELTVRLGEVAMPVGRVRSLKPGDIIPLNRRPSDPVVGLVEGLPKFHGVTGVYRGSRALQITKALKSSVGR
jgi:flagellar motor switch protein FliM